jgi:hypothetical protein
MSEQFPGELDTVKTALKQAELSPIKPNNNSDPDSNNSPISPRSHSSSDGSSPILEPTRYSNEIGQGQVEKQQLLPLSSSAEKNESMALALVAQQQQAQQQQAQPQSAGSNVDPLTLLNGLSEKLAKTRAAIEMEFRTPKGLLLKFLKLHEESNQLKQRLNTNEIKRKQYRNNVIHFLNKIECRNIPLSKFLDHDDLKALGYPENIRLTSRARTTRSSKLISEKLSENETVDAIIDGIVQSCGVTMDQGKALYEQWMNIALVAKIARRTIGNQLANEIESKKEIVKHITHYYLSVTGKKQSGKKRKQTVNIVSSDDESRKSPNSIRSHSPSSPLSPTLASAPAITHSPSSPSSLTSDSEKVDAVEANEKVRVGGDNDNDRRRTSFRDSIRQESGIRQENEAGTRQRIDFELSKRPLKKARHIETIEEAEIQESRRQEIIDKRQEQDQDDQTVLSSGKPSSPSSQLSDQSPERQVEVTHHEPSLNPRIDRDDDDDDEADRQKKEAETEAETRQEKEEAEPPRADAIIAFVPPHHPQNYLGIPAPSSRIIDGRPIATSSVIAIRPSQRIQIAPSQRVQQPQQQQNRSGEIKAMPKVIAPSQRALPPSQRQSLQVKAGIKRANIPPSAIPPSHRNRLPPSRQLLLPVPTEIIDD